MEANKFKQAQLNGPASVSMETHLHVPIYPTPPAEILPDMKGAIRALRGRLMKGGGWTDTIGKMLHLIGAEDLFNEDKYKPKVRITTEAGKFFFSLKGIKHLQGHNIYLKVAGTTIWERKIFFGGAKFTLERHAETETEALEVFLKGVIKNKEVGVESDTHQLAFKNKPKATE